MDSYSEFEKLINYKLEARCEAGADEIIAYTLSLEVLYVFAFKFLAASTENPIKEIIEFTRTLSQFKRAPLCNIYMLITLFSNRRS